MNKKEDKKFSNFELFEFGVNKNDLVFHDTLEDLRKYPPGMVIAECIKSIKFSINKTDYIQTLKKGNQYIMALGVYEKMRDIDPQRGRILKPGRFQFKNSYKPYFGQDLTNKKLLIFRTGGIGDLLFIQPNLIFLKNKYPSCEIRFACNAQYQPMVKSWGCVDEVCDLPFKHTTFLNSDYHAIFEGVIERTKESQTVNSYNLFTKWLGLNLPNELLIPSQKPSEEHIKKCKEILEKFKFSEDFILVQMRASSPIRTPSPDTFWKPLIEMLLNNGHKVILTDLPAHSDTINEFINLFPNHLKYSLLNFSEFSESLEDVISLSSLSKLVIGTDSSLLHIGASLNKKIFGIYGPFPGRVRLSTYKNCDWVDGTCPISPCFLHGQDPCPNSTKGYSNCYNNINLKECVERINTLLEGENND